MVATIDRTISHFLLPLAHHFRAAGWRVDAMANGVTRSPACLESFDAVWHASWTRSLRQGRGILTAARDLRRLVLREGYDVVHFHTPIAAFAGRLALRRLRATGRVRVVYTAHGFHFHERGSPLRNASFLSLERLAGHWTDYLLVMNADDEAAARHHRIVPPDRIVFVPGVGIDLDVWNPGRRTPEVAARVREEFGIPPGAPMVLMLARFDAGKRHHDLLDAVLHLGRPDVHVVLAGSPGPTLESVQARAAAPPLTGRVHLPGWRPDVADLLAASNVAVTTSEREGLPRSVLEALAIGVPAVGSDIRGVRDLLGGAAGLLYPVGDTRALAGALARVLDDPGLVAGLVQQGLTVAAEHGVDRVIDVHVPIYEGVLARQP